MPPPLSPTADTSVPATRAAGRRLPSWWTWVAGTVVGLVVLGPGLRPGSLLNLDLLVTPHIPVPNGVYGLGPALSQRVPSFVVLALGSRVLGGPLAVKLAIVAMVAAAFVGAARLPGPRARAATQAAAGVLWAAGPFAVTRIGVGHLNVVLALAVLPWVLPRLCRPSEAPWSTFLAAGLLAFGGPGSGTLGVAVAGVALLVERDRRPVRVVAAVGAANLVWVLPTAVLLWAGAAVTGAGGFATHPGGTAGWFGLLVGNGFWRADEQVGAIGGWGAAVAVVLLGLAVVGRRRLDPRWSGPATVVAVVGLALAVASAVPGVRDAYRWLSDLSIGAPLRESNRFLALWLVVAAPAAALGGEELARRLEHRGAGSRPGPDVDVDADVAADGDGPVGVAAGSWRSAVAFAPVVGAVPLALAVALALPGWWGIGGRLEPVHFPAGWSAARAAIDADPGPVVAFPWSEYPTISFAQGRQAFNPVPDYLGGDVISSYDPMFDPAVPSQEQVDRRAQVVDRLSRKVRRGGEIGADLADLGVRWIVVVHERGWASYRALSGDRTLRRSLHGDDVDLYEVRAWKGPAVDRSGGTFRVDRPIPPILFTDAPAGSVLQISGAPGWLQGWFHPARVTADGRLSLTREGGVVWFWPAPALLAFDLALAVVALRAAISRHRTRRSDMPPAEILAPDPLGG